jgi:hypothetical protein
LNPDGFFLEAHVKLRPVEFGADGVYLFWCGDEVFWGACSAAIPEEERTIVRKSKEKEVS